VKPKLTKEETAFDPDDAKSSPNARRARWEQLIAQHKGSIDVQVAKAFEGDKYDIVDQREGPTERTLCGAVEASPRGVPQWDWAPFYPGGTVQAKAIDASMAGRLELAAALGRPCASDFRADDFLNGHVEYGWMRGLLRDMPSGPWTRFAAGMTAK